MPATGAVLPPIASEEVGPEELDVVAVRLLQLRVLVQLLLLGVGGVERPAVAPADVERALGPVEVSADLMLLGLVVGELPVLPGAGERLELVDRDLVVRARRWSAPCR
jgi:hypothetical protein